MSKKGIFKVWFGWMLWLLLIGLTLLLLVALFDLSGKAWLDAGILRLIELSKAAIFADSWLFAAAATLWRGGGATYFLLPILLGILLLMEATRPRFWLKCPNCQAPRVGHQSRGVWQTLQRRKLLVWQKGS